MPKMVDRFMMHGLKQVSGETGFYFQFVARLDQILKGYLSANSSITHSSFM